MIEPDNCNERITYHVTQRGRPQRQESCESRMSGALKSKTMTVMTTANTPSENAQSKESKTAYKSTAWCPVL